MTELAAGGPTVKPPPVRTPGMGRCGICGGPATGMVRDDPAHAECVRLADGRRRSGMCAKCGKRPIEHDGRCSVCNNEW